MKYSLSCCIMISALLLLCSCGRIASTDDKGISSNEAVNSLKDGALVVRIPMGNNKSLKLKKLMKSTKASETSLRLYHDMLVSHEADRKAYSLKLINAVATYFDITDLYFIPDSNFTHFTKGVHKGIFFNSKAEIDEKIEFGKDKYLFLFQDDDYEVYFADKHLNLPRSPFPSKLSMNLFKGLVRVLGGGFQGENRLRKDLIQYKEKIYLLNQGMVQ